VRTNVRDEDVRIYRLRMPPPQARALLLEYVAEANDLARTPRSTNCTVWSARCAPPAIGLPYSADRLCSGLRL
jgi:uncharacterized protein DUF4105